MTKTRSKTHSTIFIGAALLWAAAASAQDARTTAKVSLRAGPDVTYPAVAVLGARKIVDVVGCIRDYSWCDVTNGRQRGWVPGRTLQYLYQRKQVPVYSYGARIGLPIVTFSLLDYWDDNYRTRSWYQERPRYYAAPHANWSNDRGPREISQLRNVFIKLA